MQRFIEEEDSEYIEGDYTFCRTAAQKRRHTEFTKKYFTNKISTHYLEISQTTGKRRTQLFKPTQPNDGDWVGHKRVKNDKEVKQPQTERKNQKQLVSSVEEDERVEQKNREMKEKYRENEALKKKREESKEKVFIPK